MSIWLCQVKCTGCFAGIREVNISEVSIISCPENTFMGVTKRMTSFGLEMRVKQQLKSLNQIKPS